MFYYIRKMQFYNKEAVRVKRKMSFTGVGLSKGWQGGRYRDQVAKRWIWSEKQNVVVHKSNK